MSNPAEVVVQDTQQPDAIPRISASVGFARESGEWISDRKRLIAVVRTRVGHQLCPEQEDDNRSACPKIMSVCVSEQSVAWCRW